MPFYEIQHSTPLSPTQKHDLAQTTTRLHSTTFNAPSLFVNVKFTDVDNEDYFIGGRKRDGANRIFVHVRGGGTRSHEAFAELAKEIEKLWYDMLGVKMDGNLGEKELYAVFIVPGIVAREKGFAIPEVS
jgi:phenylpyruvate tautomerase PptA (4-oxalocrotonate tautomerase family)